MVECGGCKRSVSYYHALEAAEWSKSRMQMPALQRSDYLQVSRVGEEPVLDYVTCACSPKQRASSTRPVSELDRVGRRLPPGR